MVDSAENGGAAGQVIAADAFEDRRAVMQDMGHYVDGRVVPVDQLAVVPDFFGLLDCHAFSLEDHYNGAITGQRPVALD